MSEILNIVFNGFFLLIEIVIVVGIILKYKRNRVTKEDLEENKEETVKTVYGEIIDKQFVMRRIQSINGPPKNKAECILTFKCGEEKLFFSVSEMFFDSYKKGQKGDIIYKGETLIEFKEK